VSGGVHNNSTLQQGRELSQIMHWHPTIVAALAFSGHQVLILQAKKCVPMAQPPDPSTTAGKVD